VRDAEAVRVRAFGAAFALDGGLLGAASSAAVRRQVGEYEAGDRRAFDLPVSYPASFIGRVMRTIDRIPYGETRTCGDLADALDTAPVAVGGACGRNRLPLVIPCHRVVGADGSLGGYSAPGGPSCKRRGLDHEREHRQRGTAEP